MITNQSKYVSKHKHDPYNLIIELGSVDIEFAVLGSIHENLTWIKGIKLDFLNDHMYLWSNKELHINELKYNPYQKWRDALYAGEDISCTPNKKLNPFDFET